MSAKERSTTQYALVRHAPDWGLVNEIGLVIDSWGEGRVVWFTVRFESGREITLSDGHVLTSADLDWLRSCRTVSA